MGVVMQMAELADIEAAAAWEADLRALVEAFVRFERSSPNAWEGGVVPPPLAAFGERHGVAWPSLESSRFLVRGSLAEATEILRVDRLVCFWGNGFELGGATLQQIAKRRGATAACAEGHLVVRHAQPRARAEELAAFLRDEDHEGHFSVLDAEQPLPPHTLYTITFEGTSERVRLVFDGSGMQDWAFVAALPQLDGEDPSLRDLG